MSSLQDEHYLYIRTKHYSNNGHIGHYVSIAYKY